MRLYQTGAPLTGARSDLVPHARVLLSAGSRRRATAGDRDAAADPGRRALLVHGRERDGPAETDGRTDGPAEPTARPNRPAGREAVVTRWRTSLPHRPAGRTGGGGDQVEDIAAAPTGPDGRRW